MSDAALTQESDHRNLKPSLAIEPAGIVGSVSAMDTTASTFEPVRADAEEYEAAILQALAAIDGDVELEHAEASLRVQGTVAKTLNWTREQQDIAYQYLAERGRIEAGDREHVLNAMRAFKERRGEAGTICVKG